MATTYQKISGLTTASGAGANDRFVILTNATSTPLLQTISYPVVLTTISGSFVNTTSPIISNSITVNTYFAANTSGTYTVNAYANNLTVNTANVNVKLQVGNAAVGFAFGAAALVQVDGNQNTYVQTILQNANSGTNATTDLILTADTGTDSINYLDIGINSSTYSNTQYTIGSPLDGYIYASNSNLTIGTATANELVFHANGTTSSDRKLTVNATSVYVSNNVSFISNSGTFYGAVTVGTNLTVNGNFSVTGNVTFAGNTTFINATVITTNDKNFILANNAATALAADGAGIIIGSYANLVYDNVTNSWQSNVGITPLTNNLNLGNTSLVWNIFSNNITAANVLVGTTSGFTRANSSAVSVGNSTVNTTITSTTVTIAANNLGGFYVGNTVSNSYVNATGFFTTGKIGVSNAASSDTIRVEGTISALASLAVSNSSGVITLANTSGLFINNASGSINVGNSTVNTFSNSTYLFSGNSTFYGFVNSTAEAIVSPTSNTIITANGITTNGIPYPTVVTMLTYNLAF